MKNRRERSLVGLVMITLLSLALSSCTNHDSLQERDFGAYYTRLVTGADWEMFDRMGDFADIIIDMGSGKGKFIFWRGAMCSLPFGF